MTTISGGELLLQCLHNEGVDMLFGVLDGSFNAFLAKLDDYAMSYICPGTKRPPLTWPKPGPG